MCQVSAKSIFFGELCENSIWYNPYSHGYLDRKCSYKYISDWRVTLGPLDLDFERKSQLQFLKVVGFC